MSQVVGARQDPVAEQDASAREALAFFAVAARTLPAAAVARVASRDDAQAYEVMFAAFRAELERVAPEAPSSLPVEELCTSCATSAATANGFCRLCAAARHQADLLREQRDRTRGAQERSGW